MAPQNATYSLPLDKVSLVAICESERFNDMDRREQYLNAAQDFAKNYDWDGRLVTDPASPIDPGWIVPMAMRKPCARYDLAKIIVSRFNGLLFGVDRFPAMKVAGARDAEEYVRGILEATRLPTLAIEARRLGGACGAVGASFAFVEGKPRVEIHNGKHIEILDWRDRAELKPSAVLKAYKYPRRTYDPVTGKTKIVDFYYARLWTETDETVWAPIPFDVANTSDWSTQPHDKVEHGFGFCPFYWTQNLPCTEDEVGYSDFHNMEDNLDEVNRLLSAQVRAVKANADPTLVVHTDPSHNEGMIRKGQGAAIFAERGAAYLTLQADSMKALDSTLERLRAVTLDMASCVVADPETLSGAAQSARALEILYAPMLAQTDVYREQYGERFIKPIVIGILRAAKMMGTRSGSSMDDAGTVQKLRYVVTLPPRVEVDEAGNAKFLERLPGKSEEITLNWNPYFPPSWGDIKSAAEALGKASGDKPIISQRTAVASGANLFGVTNVDEELEEIRKEADEAMKAAAEAMSELGPKPAAIDGKIGDDADKSFEDPDGGDDGKSAP